MEKVIVLVLSKFFNKTVSNFQFRTHPQMWLFLLGFQNMLYMPSFVFLCNFCRFQRPTGAIPSSMLGLEAVTGSLEDFGFEHYLNGNYVLLMF